MSSTQRNSLLGAPEPQTVTLEERHCRVNALSGVSGGHCRGQAICVWAILVKILCEVGGAVKEFPCGRP